MHQADPLNAAGACGGKDLPSLQGGALLERAPSWTLRRELRLLLAGAASGPSGEARESRGGARHGELRWRMARESAAREGQRRRSLRGASDVAAHNAGELLRRDREESGTRD